MAMEGPGRHAWEFGAEVYLWGAGISGNSTAGDEIDFPFSDLIKNLDMGIMGTVAVRKGQRDYQATSASFQSRSPVAWMEPGRQNHVRGNASVFACASEQTATTDCPAESRDTSPPGFGAILDSAPLVPAKSPTSSRSSSPGASASAFPMFRCAASRLRDCSDATDPGRAHQIGGGCFVIKYFYAEP